MRISEVAERSGVSARMLRYYDRQGVVRPSGRTTSGYREYDEQDVWRLLRVEGLRALGLGLREVREALDAEPGGPGSLLGELVSRTRAQLAQQRELLSRLEQLEASGPADWARALDTVQLIKRLGSGRAESRYRAAIDSAAGSAPPAGPIVRALLDEPEPGVAAALRWALGRAEDLDAGEAVGQLARALDHPDPDVRERAVRAIARIDAARAEPLLVRALTDPSGEVRALSALALGPRGGGAAELAVPALIDLVITGERDVEAAEALGAIAASAGAEMPERIVRALAVRIDAFDGTPESRRRVAQALAELPLRATGSLLDRLATDEDRDTARIADYVRGLAE